MGNITYTRGTTYALTHTYQVNGVNSNLGATLLFTVKSAPNDSDATDATAILKKDVTMSGAVNSFTILPTDIADTVEPGTYFYDLKVVQTDGKIYPAGNGQFILQATPTNRLT